MNTAAVFAVAFAIAVFSSLFAGVWALSGWQGGAQDEPPWFIWPIGLTVPWLWFSYYMGWYV